MHKVEGFNFSEEYKEWYGSIKVKPSKLLSKRDMLLYGFMESKNQEMSEEVYNTICYIQNNFDIIYEKILQTVLELNKSGIIFETCNLNDPNFNSFSPITFSNIKEIPPYLGKASFDLLPNYKKEKYVYYTINFQDECFLSIEHGLNFLFFKDEIIDWQPYSDSYYMAEKLEGYEKDCTKWKKEFWKVFREYSDPYESNKDLIREKWLKE